jgi:hypothetical protein
MSDGSGNACHQQRSSASKNPEPKSNPESREWGNAKEKNASEVGAREEAKKGSKNFVAS